MDIVNCHTTCRAHIDNLRPSLEVSPELRWATLKCTSNIEFLNCAKTSCPEFFSEFHDTILKDEESFLKKFNCKLPTANGPSTSNQPLVIQPTTTTEPSSTNLLPNDYFFDEKIFAVDFYDKPCSDKFVHAVDERVYADPPSIEDIKYIKSNCGYGSNLDNNADITSTSIITLVTM
eukprot:Pgem_evm1s8167